MNGTLPSRRIIPAPAKTEPGIPFQAVPRDTNPHPIRADVCFPTGCDLVILQRKNEIRRKKPRQDSGSKTAHRLPVSFMHESDYFSRKKDSSGDAAHKSTGEAT
jgi:hypothetical protein